jgi:2-keto-4-pentenoate hydratase/2-oxohepta-3-ene-1,7-dioic acid hydratase in catechol pathway
MRLVTYDSGRGPRAGVLSGEHGIVDIWDSLDESPRCEPSLSEVIRAGLLEKARGVEDAEPAAHVHESALLPPIVDPQKIVCLGLNYRSHAEETGRDAPEQPTVFAKFANALAPPGATVKLPAYSEKVDYEAEVAFVVGERCKDVSEADAVSKIAGYMLLNDLSARDFQFKTPQWMPGKVFDGAAPCGPALVTPDEAGPPDQIEIQLTLNGEVMQHATTADLIHSIPALVAHLSMLMTLEPGDIVSTGTPAGVGSVREPRVWLKPGDEVVITSPQLGTLETTLAR